MQRTRPWPGLRSGIREWRIRGGRPRELASGTLGANLQGRLLAAQPRYHAVLLFRVENPDVPSPQAAEELGARLGTSLALRSGPQGPAADARQIR